MSRCLKRLTNKALEFGFGFQFPPLFHLFNQSANFLFSLLRRTLFKSMDSLFFSNNNDDDDLFSNSFDQSFLPPSFTDPGDSLYLVSFRWWNEAVCGGAVVEDTTAVLYGATSQLNGGVADQSVGGTEILVGLRREDEAGISGDEGNHGGEGDLALLSEWMFFTSLKWHYDKKGMENSLPGEDSGHDLFSLQIRLMFVRETRQLIIKINQQDNGHSSFNKAHSIFTKFGMLQVWDFSGQTNQLFLNDNLSSVDMVRSHEEILLELHVYGLPCSINEKESSDENVALTQPTMNRSSSRSALTMNGSPPRSALTMNSSPPRSALTMNGPSTSYALTMDGSADKLNFFSKVPQSAAACSAVNGSGSLGLTGLYNLGNTCFMNSAVQCLVHTPKLVDYFLGNFRKDLNYENPLGMNGKLAIAFGDLLRKLWAPEAKPVAPRMFKSTISSFAPQFGGYNQHDSQEFLSFLLDGLHEDLNRVKRKPYVQAKEEDGRSDEEVADEYWENHLSRNDSVIVDLCQGQYRSSLVCPVCKKLSVTFDPFMYLSLPLPSSTMRKMTLTILSTDGSNLPHPVTVTVPHSGTRKDLVDALGTACSLRDDETLYISEIYNNSILQALDNPIGSIELIRDYDKLVAYRLPKDMDGCPLVEFTHQVEEKSYLHSFPSFRKFGIPLVARISDFSKGSEIYKAFLKIISPFLLPREEESLTDLDTRDNAQEDAEIEDTVSDEAENSKDETENDLDSQSDFEFHMENGAYSSGLRIQMDEPVPTFNYGQRIRVCVTWSQKMFRDYDTSMLSHLPEVCKTASMSKGTQDSISLYKCVEAFLKEEPLGPEDMWYCPNCKEHRQAGKKLDLWRLPEILVIHLKRFSYTRFSKNKLETFVDFPVENFDLSNYILKKNNKDCHRYMLYAISNHYGGMGGGHYTAFAKHRVDSWYEFDDSHVYPVTEEQIKTQAAYVLFYKRV
ncbi:ubiquitin carboxyl-terminal hydrolase 8-like isoform X1 [Salvia hispanica]|uniref:ubiquitin carboxyl-terminal hydrolase 8-like isoform X1 n=1 Tax=Salvia hispanica TaxID=49212 RepID=UPI002008F838|nr:ubiquitin carboxyl-terminal hydrolase 8-like isoform X1 [Salvia hispanica]XP_047960147.1 ubiquitin carboxyl-terminal hydrolase 8-like isoform X1 [Salvia hispanica]XP_047960148.1 ubiquitin carboxyl-terminal hydrolase 8-like isoform X1 [Salvia hispanica]